MTDYTSGPKRPGDRGDPVADNIRAEMNRDAAPRSPEDVGDPMADAECENCGETDSSKLDQVAIPMPECPAVQTPPEPFQVLCDECEAALPTAKEAAVERAVERHETEYYDPVVAVAFYECGRSWILNPPERDEPLPPGAMSGPSIPLYCSCGAKVEEVVEIGGESGQ